MNTKIRGFSKCLIGFIALYPIIPAYFKIIGFSFPNFCCISLIAISILYRKAHLRIKKDGVVFTLLMWMIVNVAMYFYHDYFFGAIWCICTVVAILILSDNIKTKDLFIRTLLTIVYVTGIVCCFGVLESLTGFNIFSFLNTSGDVVNINPVRFGITRIVGFAYQTISYAVYLDIVACLCFYLLTLRNCISSKQIKIVKIIYLLIFVNLLLTLSRSAILIFAIIHVMLLWKMGIKKVLKTFFFGLVLAVLALFILSLVAPNIFHQIQNMFYMMMAVFDSDYTALIQAEFGKDNLNAVGTRTDIYGWVYETVKDKIWTGVGFKTAFSYEYDSGNMWHTMITKTAIEVEYLLTLYQAGIIGVVAEGFLLIRLVWSSFTKSFKCTSWENKMSFNYLCFVAFISVVVMYFMVNKSSEQYLFNIVIALFMAYNFKVKKETTYDNRINGNGVRI